MNAREFMKIPLYANIPKDISLIDFVAMVAEDYHQYRIKKSGYAYFDGQLFPIGTKLTSKENGELIPADKETPDELIVGTVK